MPSISTLAVEDGLVVVGPGAAGLYLLNRTARFVWERCEAGSPSDAIAVEYADRFGVPHPVASSDVTGLLAQWVEAGLIGGGFEETPACTTVTPAGASAGRVSINPAVFSEKFIGVGGYSFHIRFGTSELEHALLPIVAHLERTRQDTLTPDSSLHLEEGPTGYELHQDGFSVLSCADIGTLQLGFHHRIGLTLCNSVERLAILHAGGVSNGDSAIVMSAPGGSGKSTLTAALVAEGLLYLGDDIIPLERTNRRVVPVPTALNLKSGSIAPLIRRYPGIEQVPGIPRRGTKVHLTPPLNFGMAADEKGYPVAHLVFPRFVIGSDTIVAAVDSTLEKLERLMAANAWIDRPIDTGKIRELVQWLDSVPASTLSFSRLDEAVTFVRELFEQ